ncbi:hypothetical protein B4125_2104 [Bacillus paralicheniformis]|uniref:Uncharacterized protein n=1 Tax=Bacillus paralicheniformis TaxID=1648923 RepID=A0ABY3G2C8_9BACI|nr:hypothetical protein SC10_B2orf03809 [Bacillus paralicheniformis]OLG07923.1 hypothetical protein B4125_2104 [Bacillus paralicheniformis]TWK42229.1 hypothetical protein CHCC20347_2343 [Bacillus paralicheniformis]TWL44661.1 hypothetical protein CHCC15381_2667 [Bacillus paralicheniformis]TWN71206.1 hypothetical protein CHCC12620_2107 [Bacillus paralicheniformis]
MRLSFRYEHQLDDSPRKISSNIKTPPFMKGGVPAHGSFKL